jgi:hypothetical protein
VKCERVREIASDALDGLLSPEDADAFHGHLAHCRACVFFYERMREAVALLDEVPDVDVRPGFNESVWARLAEEGEAAPGVTGLLGSWRARLAVWRESLAPTWGAAQWSIAGVAAAVVAMVAISAEPPSPFFADRSEEASRPVTAEAVRAAESTVAVAPVRTAPDVRREQVGALRGSVVRIRPRELASTFEEAADEVSADMPEAVEAFLRNSRELRLTNEDDRYRRANYTYPLRRFPDVSPLLLVGEEAPGVGMGARPAADQGTAVIAF